MIKRKENGYSERLYNDFFEFFLYLLSFTILLVVVIDCLFLNFIIKEEGK